MNRYYKPNNQAAAVVFGLLLLLLSLSACSDSGGNVPELPDEPKMCTVTISLSSGTSMHPVTKATGESIGGDTVYPDDWEAEEEQYERKIDHWLIVAYDKQGMYAGHIRDTKLGEVDDNTNVDGAEDGDYKISCEMELPEGNYTFYAFANLGSLDNYDTDAEYNTFVDGLKTSSPADLKKMAVQVGSIDTKFNAPSSGDKKLIPMSSYGYEKWISESTEFSIALIRMIGKVRVKAQNALTTKEAVTVKTISLGNFQEQREIFLVPYERGSLYHYLEFANDFTYYEHWGPSFPDGQETQSATKVYGLSLGENGTEIPYSTTDLWTPLPTSYVNESMLSSNTDKASMTITVERKGTSGHTETTTHFTDFNFVRRNDLLEIPILISDLTGLLKFRSTRIPIGVYPTEIAFGEPGESIQILTPVTYVHEYAGELEIQYELTSAPKGSDWKIRYKPEDEIVTGRKYSEIRLYSNINDFLIDEKTATPLSEGNVISFKQQDDLSGSFCVYSQEIAKNASAQIKLTLVVEYEKGTREIEIPYTINIVNKSTTANGTDTEGGQS